MKKKIKILFVDYEDYNRLSFEANFRKSFEIVAVSEFDSAQKLLSQDNSLKIIIIELAGINGFQILDEIDNNIIKIITYSKPSDSEEVEQALLNNKIFCSFIKPWDLNYIDLKLREAVIKLQQQ